MGGVEPAGAHRVSRRTASSSLRPFHRSFWLYELIKVTQVGGICAVISSWLGAGAAVIILYRADSRFDEINWLFYQNG